jgi:hypothetical protein
MKCLIIEHTPENYLDAEKIYSDLIKAFKKLEKRKLVKFSDIEKHIYMKEGLNEIT